MYHELLRNYRSADNVSFYNMALSEKCGRSTFVEVVSNLGFSGLQERNYPKAEETQELIVETQTLDTVIPTRTKIDFIKVDVEGAELGVFKGAVNLLRRDKPYIVFEHGLGAADCYGTKPEDVYTVLVEECGLLLTTMGEWLDHAGKPEPFTKEEFVDQF